MPTPFIAEAGVYAQLAIAYPGSPTTYTTIANVIGEIGGLGGSTKMVDVTPHGPSPWSVMFPTLITFGAVTLELAFVASGTGQGSHGAASGLMASWSTQTLEEFRMTFPDGTVWYWAAYISKFEISAPVNGVVTAKVTLETTGEPLLA